jgi:hypothetical protein
MSIPVEHNWQPSTRLLQLMERMPIDQREMLKSKIPNLNLPYMIDKKLLGKIKVRTYNALMRGISSGYLDNMTWDDFVKEVKDTKDIKKSFVRSRFIAIRDFGAGALRDIYEALDQ